MKTVSRLIEGVTIVDVSGRIVLGEECAAIRDLVSDLLGKGRMKILFNLADVDYIDSAGLGTMVSAFTSVKNHGGQLKLLHLKDKVRGLLQITKLYTVFDVMDDETAAIQSFGQSATTTG
jgi:anti-sigma B factor antagonist